MNGVSWQRVAAIGLFVAGAIVAHVIGAATLATALGSGALLAFPLGRLGHRPLSDDPRAVQSFQDALASALRGRVDGEMPGEATAKVVLDAAEKRRPSRPPK